MTTSRPLRPTSRSAALALSALLALPGLASADGLAAGGDGVIAGLEPTIDLGAVAPSTTLSLTVDFALTCANGTHVDPGQTVTLEYGGGFQPAGGEIVAVSGGNVGPAPADWPVDGAACSSPARLLTGTAPSTVELRAPAVPGDDYKYFITWTRSFSPTGTLDSSAVKGGTTLTVIVDVVDNTPPTLDLPSDLSVEGDTTGGWIVAFAATATDDQDDPDPTPSCGVPQGDVLPLGPTTIACSVTDRGGMTDSGSFEVTVVDTTDPTLTAPDDQAVTTSDPAGATLDYDSPAAGDVVDADPTVACSPASGTAIPLGTTTVTCTATDDSGNSRSATFDVVVTHEAAHVAMVVWGEPVGDGTSTFVAQRGRTVPVKAVLAIDGEVRAVGDAALTVTPCGGGQAYGLVMSYGGGRWTAALDTSALVGSCHTVVATIDGLTAGSFELGIRGVTPTPAKVGLRRRGG